MNYPAYQQDPNQPQQPAQDPAYAAWLASQQAAPQAPQYAPPVPQYAPPVPQYAPPAPPAAPLPQASGLADFWDQRATGQGPSLKFPTVGTAHSFLVVRDLNKGDVQPVTNTKNEVQTNKDGSPKWVLIIPGTLPNGEECTWWCKGQAKTALQAALEPFGHQSPVKNSVITVTYIKDRPNGPGFNPTKIMDVRYQPPAGSEIKAPVVEAPVAEVVAPAPEAPISPVPPVPAPPAPVQFTQAPVPAPVAPPVPQAPAPTAGQDPRALFQSLLNDQS